MVDNFADDAGHNAADSTGADSLGGKGGGKGAKI